MIVDKSFISKIEAALDLIKNTPRNIDITSSLIPLRGAFDVFGINLAELETSYSRTRLPQSSTTLADLYWENYQKQFDVYRLRFLTALTDFSIRQQKEILNK